MAELTAVHNKGASRRIGSMITACSSAGIITSTIIAANATITLLKAAILVLAVGPKASLGVKLNKALDKGIAIGTYTETHGLTTVAGFVAATQAGTTMKSSFL